ncbi:MAG TPA: 7-cyano-7-deazaguanine synthase QueC [Alphaproteobacteria bacterium]|nr:7-cyano-7-deazaguanine synthase QueC [Alphaproteobacteria bacterium]
MKALAVVSGGLDSVTLAHLLAEENSLGGLVSFDYGQRHKKELAFAAAAAKRLDAAHHVIDISEIAAHLKGSALTDNVDVPEGHYASENMKQTIVPNRNAIMLAVAYGIAPAYGYDAVAIAIHTGDHFIYPDCRPEFAALFDQMERKAMEGFADIKLLTPFATKTKGDIATEAVRLKVPVIETWSCYKGGAVHCGRCGTCVERREAFSVAGSADPTQYEDQDFWKKAVNR